jgi:hypothetical protein
MSHFTVLVIGENPEEQLTPYQENNMEDCPKEYLEFNDVEEEYREDWEKEGRQEFYCSSSSSWGQELNEEAFNLLENKDIGSEIILPILEREFSYLQLNKYYKCYNSSKEKDGYPEKHIWIKVIEIIYNGEHPNPEVCFNGVVKVKLIDPPNEIKHKEWYSSFEEFIEDWGGYEKNENGKYGYWENPNAKWDWYQIGGRWNGFFKLKEKLKLNDPNGIANKYGFSKGEMETFIKMAKEDLEKFKEIVSKYGATSIEIQEDILKLVKIDYADGKVGKPGLFGNNPHTDYNGRADQVYKRDIDFETMYKESVEKATWRYETIEKFFNGTIPKIEKSWKEFMEEAEAEKITWDEARKEYHAQDSLELKKELSEKYKGTSPNKDSEEYNLLTWFQLSDYQIPKEQYVEQARNKTLSTFAVVKDDKWYEKGEMGWWGCTSNEKDQAEWDNQVNRLIKSCPDDTLFTLVDCHI